MESALMMILLKINLIFLRKDIIFFDLWERRYLLKHLQLINIPNIAFKIEGQIYDTIRKPFSLDSAPIIKRDEKIIGVIKKTNGIARIEASRGCAWRHCTFCCVNSKYADPNWRGFSIEKITNELIDLSNMGILSPYFTDEDFYGNQPSRVKALADAITDLKLNGKINYKMDFFLSILTNDIAKPEGKEALKALKKAGLREVFMGIESLGCDQLKRFNKKAIPDLNKKAISFVKSLGLQVDLGFILFDPEMSIEELISNVEYIDDLKLNNYDSRSIKRLRLQPRTAYANNYIDSSYILDINNLEYPYVFKNKKVNTVYTMYKKWEDECVAKVWRYQALTRGENVPDRELLKQALGEIRNVDFKALKVILTYIDETTSENEYLIQIGKLRAEKQVIMKNLEALLIK